VHDLSSHTRPPEPPLPDPSLPDESRGDRPDDGPSILGEFLRAAYRHRWLGVTTFVLVAAPVLAWTWSQVPEYEARLTLLVESEPPSPLPFTDTQASRASGEQFRTQRQMLHSRALAIRSVTALRLWEHPEFAPMVADLPQDAPASGVDPRAERLAGPFLARVRSGEVELTRLVNVWFLSRDPELAARGANTLADEFIQFDLESRFDTARQGTQWLETQLEDQRRKVEASEAALQAYREGADASAVGTPQNIVTQRLADINAALTRARTERLQKEAVKQQLDEAEAAGTLDAIPAIAMSGVVQQLRAQEGELEREAAELSRRFGERHPEMIKVRTALEQTRQRRQAEVARIAEVVRREFDAAVANERSLTSALESQKGASVRLSQQELEFGRLQRDADTNRQIYDTLLQQARQLGISSELKQPAVRVVDRAQVPGQPVRPDRVMLSGLALALGLVAASVVVFGREHLDTRLKTPDDVKRELRLPFLGMLPVSVSDSGADGPAFLPATHAGFSEAVRRVRTALLLLSPRSGVQTLLVTSSGPQEGKSTVCVALAQSLAAAGSRVLLVDADLRRPTVHKSLDLPRAPGIGDLLARKAMPGDVVQKTSTPLLSVVTAGAHQDGSTELIGSPLLAGFLESQEGAFDWIVIDSPPVLAASDAPLVARLTTGVLFVVGAEMIPRAEARRAIEQLVMGGAHFAGVVLNRADVDRHSRYYGPYYNKKYQAYYEQAGEA